MILLLTAEERARPCVLTKCLCPRSRGRSLFRLETARPTLHRRGIHSLLSGSSLHRQNGKSRFGVLEKLQIHCIAALLFVHQPRLQLSFYHSIIRFSPTFGASPGLISNTTGPRADGSWPRRNHDQSSAFDSLSSCLMLRYFSY